MYKREERQKVTEKSPLLVYLANQCVADSHRWFGDRHVERSIPHYTLALAGEVGELANLVKKIERGSLDMKDARVRHNVTMELTDAFVYVLTLAGLLGVDLEVTYKMVRAANEKRFTAERDKRERAQSNGS